MRATEILAIVRRLESASLDELLVVGVAIARLESLRGRPAGPSTGIDAEPLIDRALRLELGDIKLTREGLNALHEADRAAMDQSTWTEEQWEVAREIVHDAQLDGDSDDAIGGEG